jgi:hypothetical protein
MKVWISAPGAGSQRSSPRDGQSLTVRQSFFQQHRSGAAQSLCYPCRREARSSHHHRMPQLVALGEGLGESRVIVLLVCDDEADSTALNRFLDQPRNFEARNTEILRDLQLGVSADEVAMGDRRHQ